MFGVEEPATPPETRASESKRSAAWPTSRRLGRRYAIVVAIAAVLTLARFSEAFLILRAQNVGVPAAMAPWVMVVMSTVYAVVAYPAGAAADRGLGPRMLSAGFVGVDRRGPRPRQCRRRDDGICRRGAVGAAHGADAGPARRARRRGGARRSCAARRSACSISSAGSRCCIASVLAGWLWDTFGPGLTFYAGAAFTLIAWIALARQGGGAAELRQA